MKTTRIAANQVIATMKMARGSIITVDYVKANGEDRQFMMAAPANVRDDAASFSFFDLVANGMRSLVVSRIKKLVINGQLTVVA